MYCEFAVKAKIEKYLTIESLYVSMIMRFRSKQGLCLRFIVYEEKVNCQLHLPFSAVTVFIAKL